MSKFVLVTYMNGKLQPIFISLQGLTFHESAVLYDGITQHFTMCRCRDSYSKSIFMRILTNAYFRLYPTSIRLPDGPHIKLLRSAEYGMSISLELKLTDEEKATALTNRQFRKLLGEKPEQITIPMYINVSKFNSAQIKELLDSIESRTNAKYFKDRKTLLLTLADRFYKSLQPMAYLYGPYIKLVKVPTGDTRITSSDVVEYGRVYDPPELFRLWNYKATNF